MVTYRQPFPDMPELTVPVLHPVKVSIGEGAQRSEWLDANCTGKYYRSRGLVEFEEPDDAVLFALRWSS